MIRVLILFAATLSASSGWAAELVLPHFFSDHMVLQRERDAAIWGNASAGAEVSVSFNGKTAATTAGPDGAWRTAIATGPADGTGKSLVVTSGEDRVTIEDVLVGEVWLASGQSNMVFTMNRVPAYTSVIAETELSSIRMFNAPTVTAVEPQDDIDGQWTLCGPQTTGGYSAVAFFFARKLHHELNIPIGVIKSAWGGKPVETFTSRAALKSLPGTQALVQSAVEQDERYDDAKAQVAYLARLDQWKAAVKESREQPASTKRVPRKPAVPKRPLDTEGKPGVLFNSMIHPFIGYSIRGAIWYQGETNAKPNAVPYDLTLPLMIRDWRTRWNDEFSFYYVQLANFRAPTTEPGIPDAWALLQDRMRLVLSTTPKTGMAIINDVGAADDIHPKNKQDPGERLALWALAKDYGKDLTYSGPLFQSSAVDGNLVRVTFDQCGTGLKSRDENPLKRFEIAGEDKVWHWADAKPQGDSVLVSSPEVPAPVAVRYAWASNPEGANLVNSEGLPASVFRTDDWNDVEGEPATVKNERDARQAISDQVKAINEQRKKAKRGSEEFKELTKKSLELRNKLRSNQPAKAVKK